MSDDIETSSIDAKYSAFPEIMLILNFE